MNGNSKGWLRRAGEYMSFNDIIGQDIAVRSIKSMIEKDEVRGSYLFLGPDGVGKRTLALEFAKAINCEGHGEVPCDECASCRKIKEGNHPDILSIYPEGKSRSIKIDIIREIIYQSSLKPYEAKKRFFIINDSSSMTEESQNALLKLLEEPPRNHILILTALNTAGLLPTVCSRCKTLKFYLIQKNRIEELLKKRDICDMEAVLFSHMSLGSIGKAFSFKEKDMISKRDKVINDFFFKKTAILRENVLDRDGKEDIEDLLYILLSWYRDLLIAKFTGDKESLLNIDRAEEIASLEERFSKERIEKDIFNIMDTASNIRRNVNPKLALFNMAVELKRGQ
ncbi:MAG: DNA polymerase III subunit delta' [Candidatus Omnitrophota bacterium]